MGYRAAVDRDELLRLLPAFEEAGFEYVLIGATAGLKYHASAR